jgi:hypothetical protein
MKLYVAILWQYSQLSCANYSASFNREVFREREIFMQEKKKSGKKKYCLITFYYIVLVEEIFFLGNLYVDGMRSVDS